jgi:hypothetical protein
MLWKYLNTLHLGIPQLHERQFEEVHTLRIFTHILPSGTCDDARFFLVWSSLARVPLVPVDYLLVASASGFPHSVPDLRVHVGNETTSTPVKVTLLLVLQTVVLQYLVQRALKHFEVLVALLKYRSTSEKIRKHDRNHLSTREKWRGNNTNRKKFHSAFKY